MSAHQHLQELERTTPVAEQYPWYALQVRSNKERAIATSLRSRGYEDFLPLYTCTHTWSDRIKKVELPLFPGYLFCRFDFERRLPILTTPGVINIVGLGKLPHPVEEHEIDALQVVVRSGLLLRPWPFLKAGQRVMIQEGPLRNVEGLLSEIRGHDRRNGIRSRGRRKCWLRCLNGDRRRGNMFDIERSCRTVIGVTGKKSAEKEGWVDFKYKMSLIQIMMNSAIIISLQFRGLPQNKDHRHLVGLGVITHSIERGDIPVRSGRRLHQTVRG